MNQTRCQVCLLLLLTVPLAGQPGHPDPTPTFGEVIDVRVVNVEVVVTDGRERVAGLGAGDFRLLVDGRSVPIEYFTEVRDRRAVGPGAAGPTPAVPALEPGTPVGTRYLVFIDDDFALPPKRDRVLRSLAEQVSLLGPDDRMAVVAFDGRRAEMLTSWTRSTTELEAVFAAAQERRAYGLLRQNELRNPIFQPTSSGGKQAIGGLPKRGEPIYARVERMAGAAAAALRGFARPPGREAASARLRRDVMLLLSGGWAVPDTSGAPGTGNIAERELFQPLLDTANRLGYTLYPVDLMGVDAAGLAGVEYGSLEEANLAEERARLSDQVEEDALYHLARETGGRAFIDAGGVHALEGAVEDLRSYYWLGFSPTWREDDRRHRLEVEVRRKGLEVRSRRGFSDLSQSSVTTMMVESAQLFDRPLPAAHELEVALGEPAVEGRRAVVPLKITIPVPLITVLPDGGQYVARLELRVAATDDRGDNADIPVIPIELRDPDLPRYRSWTYSTTLTLRRRPHRLLFSLVDLASGEMLATSLDYDPGD